MRELRRELIPLEGSSRNYINIGIFYGFYGKLNQLPYEQHIND